jgi:hypothetical protein
MCQVRARRIQERETDLKTFAVASFFLSIFLASPALAQSPSLVTEEMMVKTADPGIEIYVRNKRPADMTVFRPEQTVLYVKRARESKSL